MSLDVVRMRKIDGEWLTVHAPARASFSAVMAAAFGASAVPRPGQTLTLPRRPGGRTYVRYRVARVEPGTQNVHAVILPT